jgi:RNA polymerase sigma factor (sigma-70 family)
METIRPRDAAVDDEFAALFRQHATRLVRLAYLLGADDPEDVAQEAFCRLYDRPGAVEQPRAYLDRVVVNLVRDRARRRHRRDAAILLMRPGLTPASEPSDGAMLRLADRRAVVGALERLSPRFREAVVLRYWAELPYAEVASAMNVRVGTAKSAVSRGLAQMHRMLEEER